MLLLVCAALAACAGEAAAPAPADIATATPVPRPGVALSASQALEGGAVTIAVAIRGAPEPVTLELDAGDGSPVTRSTVGNGLLRCAVLARTPRECTLPP